MVEVVSVKFDCHAVEHDGVFVDNLNLRGVSSQPGSSLVFLAGEVVGIGLGSL